MNTFSTKSSSCCVTGTSSRRITREEVITLRNIQVGKKTWLRKLTGLFHNCMRDIKTMMHAPIKSKAVTNSMCKYYGHIIHGPWQGYLPKCRDCGAEISSPDQLRKASPR